MAIAIRGVAPLLEVFDMGRSLRFYRDVLGFTVTMQSSPGDDCDWCLLERDGVELMLNTAYEQGTRPEQPEAERVAAHRDTTLFFGCPDPEEAYRHLQAAGYPAEAPTVAPYGMKQLNLKDPDGYGICFQWAAADCP